MCQCSSDRWWNTALKYCREWYFLIYNFIKLEQDYIFKCKLEKKSAYGGACSSLEECESGKNMICSSIMCTCSNANVYYWNGTYCGMQTLNPSFFLI